jgi:hypothetical protein
MIRPARVAIATTLRLLKPSTSQLTMIQAAPVTR